MGTIKIIYVYLWASTGKRVARLQFGDLFLAILEAADT